MRGEVLAEGAEQVTLARDPAKARAWQQRSAAKARENARARAAKPLVRKPKPRTAKPPARKPAKKRKALAKQNRPRLTKLRLAQFGTPEQTAMINAMPCVCGGRHPECTGGPSEPSHVVSRGAGGGIRDQVPKSGGCHNAWHQHGRGAYLEAIGWTWDEMRAEADRVFAVISGDGMPDAPRLYPPA
jgi:hypothetical protein